MKILLAEDDRATQLRLAAYVTDWGYECVAANDGEEAWALFQGQDFDCVISDWMMPNIDGLELVRRIRQTEQNAYVYIILLTGKTKKQNLVQGMEAGADDFLTKPFDIDELRVRLRAGQRVVALERRLAERNRALSTFTAVASHDLREPLRTITSFLGLLEKKYKDKLDDEAQEYIDFVMDGATRMRTLITDLLAYARMESQEKKFESLDVAALVQERLESLRQAIDESQAEVTHGPLPTIEGDRTQLGQLFQNLIGNGIKYRGEKPPVIRIEAVKEDSAWLFSVRDNGIGIPPEHQETIFEPFRRLHATGSAYSGSGVGLSICRTAIERHGGRLWVESDGHSGSTFYFTIPHREKEARADA